MGTNKLGEWPLGSMRLTPGPPMCKTKDINPVVNLAPSQEKTFRKTMKVLRLKWDLHYTVHFFGVKAHLL